MNGTVPVTLSAPAEDTATMELLVRNKVVGTATGAPWTISWNTAGLTGSTPLTVRTTDRAGNTASISRTVTVDVTGPVVAVTSPTRVTGTATVKLGVSDPAGVAKVELLRADQVLATTTTAPYAFSVDTTGMAKGVQTWMIRATDSFGNVTNVSRVFTIY